MATCAYILRVDFGVATVSQPNISRWETGAIRRPECMNELLAYCDAYGPSMNIASPSWYASRTGQIGDPLTVVSAVDSSVDDADEFERLAGQAAGEPLPGEAQLELIRGMIHRLAHGARHYRQRIAPPIWTCLKFCKCQAGAHTAEVVLELRLHRTAGAQRYCAVNA